MSTSRQCADILNSVRSHSPLVHHLTNYVTVNDCANITLAIGGSPIMAEAIEEVQDIAKIASAVVINIGTLNPRTVASMLAAGKTANAHNVPVVLDPVGAGASALRSDTARKILDEVKLTVIRGNISEIRSLAGLTAHTKGVDAGSADAQAAATSDVAAIARDLANRTGAVVAITGARDVVSDGKKVSRIDNGVAMMARVSGTGCMCASVLGAFVGVARGNVFVAATAAIACMGIIGEIAFEQAGKGLGSFRVGLIDAASNLDGAVFLTKCRIEEDAEPK